METLIELLKKTEEFLKRKNIKNARLESEKIFARALNMDRISLYSNFNKLLSEDEKLKIRSIINEKEEYKDNSLKILLDQAIVYLNKYKVKEASIIAELIFANELKIDRLMLFMNYNKKIDEEAKKHISENLKKIAIDKMPYQYIVNKQNFFGRDFYVDKGVLIPRYDTECLVEKVLEKITDNNTILDIGTGSGIIALTIALEKPSTKVLAIDISEKAIEISNTNKQLLDVKNVKIKKSNLFENVEYNNFDIIVSNPPYISNDELADMGVDTYMHEPHEALFSKQDGLYFYYEISKQAKNYLKNDGYLAFEIGYKQKDAVIDILRSFNYVDIESFKDMNNIDRVVIARKVNDEY